LLVEQKELNSTLEERVKEEVAKNREKDHKLMAQSRLAATGEMIGNIAHHWRQPLNTIVAVAQDMKEAQKFGELDEPYVDRSVTQITQSSGYMSSVIDQFGSFFKPQEQVVEFDVGGVVGETLDAFGATFEIEGIAVKRSLQQGLNASGYPHEFRQVVMILMTNSQEAILKNGREKRIDVRLQEEEGKIHLSIKDSGGGIDASIASKVFDPYFSTKFESQGTGIGLYMAKMIVENTMNGTLSTHNVEDGCVMDITIPKA